MHFDTSTRSFFCLARCAPKRCAWFAVHLCVLGHDGGPLCQEQSHGQKRQGRYSAQANGDCSGAAHQRACQSDACAARGAKLQNCCAVAANSNQLSQTGSTQSTAVFARAPDLRAVAWAALRQRTSGLRNERAAARLGFGGERRCVPEWQHGPHCMVALSASGHMLMAVSHPAGLASLPHSVVAVSTGQRASHIVLTSSMDLFWSK